MDNGGAEQKAEQKAEQYLNDTLWNKAHKEYVDSGRWKCPEHPDGKNKGAHHWFAMNGDWVCIFCNQVKPHNEGECTPVWVLERELMDKRRAKQNELYALEGVLGALK